MSVLESFTKTFPQVRQWIESYSNVHGIEIEYKVLRPIMPEIMRLMGKLCGVTGFNSTFFLEYIKKVDAQTKIRYRTTPRNVNIYDLSVDKLPLTTTWVMKKKLDVCSDGMVSVDLASELPYTYNGKNDSVSYVQLVSYRLSYWVIELKYKFPLGNRKNDSIGNVLSSYFEPFVSVEIELHKIPTPAQYDECFQQLVKIVSKLFAPEPLMIQTVNWIDRAVQFNLLTHDLQHALILNNASTLHWKVTPKIDGKMCFFRNIDNMCIIYPRYNSFSYSFTTSFKEEIFGAGEYVFEDKICLLFHFLIYVDIASVAKTREDMLDWMDMKIQQTKQASLLVFVSKPRYTFNSHSDRCKKIFDCMNYKEYPIDGVIIYEPSYEITLDPKRQIKDYRYKLLNTVDTLGVVTIENNAMIHRSKANNIIDKEVSPNTIIMPSNVSTKENDMELRMIFYSKARGSTTANRRKVRVPYKDSIFQFDPESGVFIIESDTNELVNGLPKKIPLLSMHKNILEVDPITFQPINVRPDKMNRYVSFEPRPPNKSYIGNPAEDIDSIITIQNSVVNLQTLALLAQEFVEVAIVGAAAADSYTPVLALNADSVNEYFVKDNNTNTSLGLVCNFMKTNIILTVASPLFNSLAPGVLIIDGGKGDDIQRYYMCGIQNAILTDPNKGMLNYIEKNITNKLVNRDKKSVTKTHCIHSSILDDKYVENIKQTKIPFTIIDWQMAIHYTWGGKTKEEEVNNKNKAITVLNILSGIGTKLIISCINGEKLLSMFRNNRLNATDGEPLLTPKTTNKLVFELNSSQQAVFTYKDDRVYKYELTGSIAEMEEFFVNLDDLTNRLNAIGFHLIDSGDFKLNFFKELFSEGFMKLEVQESTSSFFAKLQSALCTITEDRFNRLMKLVGLYHYLVFERISTNKVV